ncbi:MAG: hypothetical protein ACO3JL_20305, partial [Myxococcota bacterium]
MAEQRLGDLLVEQGVVTRAKVENAAVAALTSGARIGSHLVESGAASDRQVCTALARLAEHPVLDLQASTIDLSLLDRIPKAIASDNLILPVSVGRDAVTVAVAQVGEQQLFSELELVLGLPVRPVLALHGRLTAAIERAFAEHAQGAKVLVGARSPMKAKAYLEVVRAPPPRGEGSVNALVAELAGPFAALRRVANKAAPAPAAQGQADALRDALSSLASKPASPPRRTTATAAPTGTPPAMATTPVAAAPAAPAAPLVTSSSPSGDGARVAAQLADSAPVSPPARPIAIPSPPVAAIDDGVQIPEGDGPLVVVVEDEDAIRT